MSASCLDGVVRYSRPSECCREESVSDATISVEATYDIPLLYRQRSRKGSCSLLSYYNDLPPL